MGYQIYPRSFADSGGDGIGDLPGVIGRLDYLAGLGVDVLWLSPVYPSPQADNGYDISDYCAVDPVYGTLDDFDALLAAVHERGMRLIMDLVVNHTSDRHPWFLESAAGLQSAKRDWYWWRPPRDGLEPGAPGAEPNNWGSGFGGSAWQLDPATGEYYLHLFSARQPDLNWENPEVRRAVHDVMRWWLARGVDGFRMDVINFVSKDPALPDGILTGPYGDGSPHYACGPRIHEFLAEMHREVLAPHPSRLLAVGEMPGVTIEAAREFTDPARGEVDMVFQFEHVQLDRGPQRWDLGPLRLADLKACMARWQRGLADVGWNSLYWCNHDQPRVVSRFGDDGIHRVRSATMLATVLHLHRGTPYVYQGEEIGMTNARFDSLADFRDVESLGIYADAVDGLGVPPEIVLAGLRRMSRDNARTPMQWDASPNAGFSTGVPWLAVNANHDVINVAASLADDRSVYHHYRELIALRHSEPAVVDGDFTMLAAADPQVYAFTRTLGATELLVLGNFSAAPAWPDVPAPRDWIGAELLIANSETPAGPPGFALGPWETVVYRRRIAAGGG